MTDTPCDMAIDTLEWLSASGAPRQLFVLLPEADGRGLELLALASTLGEAFEHAAVVIADTLPHAVSLDGVPLPMPNLSDAPEARPMSARLPALMTFLRQQQERFKLLQTDTALAGFGAGADLALELSDVCDGLVGRVLAFSSSYDRWSSRAPLLTTLHLLHGQLDRLAPVSAAQQSYMQLMQLQADATLDIASSVGHELHPALLEQAVRRLQTCVPLRHWRAA
jgi:phospholipase/carboxylesterase